jgi:hypothetical protein
MITRSDGIIDALRRIRDWTERFSFLFFQK